MENINVDETIIKAVRKAIAEFDEKKKEEEKDKRLHNTKLLMNHYNALKDHVEKVDDKNYKYDLLGELELEENEITSRDKVWLQSMFRTKLRTMKMLAYIDSALNIVEQKYKYNCEEYKFKAFQLHYLYELSNEEIISRLNCGKNSPKKWSDLIVKDLSVLLWGVDALEI